MSAPDHRSRTTASEPMSTTAQTDLPARNGSHVKADPALAWLRERPADRGRAEAVGGPTLSDRIWALARNLWWTWHPEVIALFRELDPVRWRELDHNPIALLA